MVTFDEVFNEVLSELPRKQRIRVRILSFVEVMKIELLYLLRNSAK